MGRKLLKIVQTITTFRNPLADPMGTRRGPPLVRGPQFENRWSTVQERERSCGGAGDYSHDRIQLEEVHAVRVARSSTLKIPDSLLPIAAFAPVSTTSASICAVRVKGTK